MFEIPEKSLQQDLFSPDLQLICPKRYSRDKNSEIYTMNVSLSPKVLF